jgi:hypothetical protein
MQLAGEQGQHPVVVVGRPVQEQMDGLVVLATDGTLQQLTLPGLSTKRIDGVKRPRK